MRKALTEATAVAIVDSWRLINATRQHVVIHVCVVSHRRFVSSVLHSQCKSPIKINEGGLGDVVDNSGDIACALVTRIPDSRGWRDDTSSARYSSDSFGN